MSYHGARGLPDSVKQKKPSSPMRKTKTLGALPVDSNQNQSAPVNVNVNLAAVDQVSSLPGERKGFVKFVKGFFEHSSSSTDLTSLPSPRLHSPRKSGISTEAPPGPTQWSAPVAVSNRARETKYLSKSVSERELAPKKIQLGRAFIQPFASTSLSSPQTTSIPYPAPATSALSSVSSSSSSSASSSSSSSSEEKPSKLNAKNRRSKQHKKNKSLDVSEANALLAGALAAGEELPQVSENSPLYGMKSGEIPKVSFEESEMSPRSALLLSAPELSKNVGEDAKMNYKRMITNSVRLPKTLFNNLMAGAEKGKDFLMDIKDIRDIKDRQKDKSEKKEDLSLHRSSPAITISKLLHSFFNTLRITSLEPYKELIKLLCSPPYLLPSAICDVVPRTEIDALTKAIVHVNLHKSTVMLLVSSLLAKEIEETNDAGTLLRSNSIVSKCVTVYSKIVAKEFMKNMLQPLISFLINTDKNWEFNPSKIEPGENIEENIKNVADMAQHFFDGIVRETVENCPKEIRMICKELRDQTSIKFPKSVHIVIGGFYFLRLLGPAIVSPEGFGIIAVVPDKSRRALVYISKLLQSLANNVKFSNKETYMEPLNPFIDYNSTKVQSLFDFISDFQEPPQREASGDIVQFDLEIEMISPNGSPSEASSASPDLRRKPRRKTATTTIGMARLSTPPTRKRTETDPDLAESKDKIEMTLLIEQINVVAYHLIISQEKLKEHLDVNGHAEYYLQVEKVIADLRQALGVDAYLNGKSSEPPKSPSL